jgi:hypothetical protein
MKPTDLIMRGLSLYNERKALTTLWQEIAENFYPQRADFTLTRYIGEEFAEHLYSSYPIIVHRELSTSLAAMLRPRAKQWFKVSVHEEDLLTQASKAWLLRAGHHRRRCGFRRLRPVLHLSGDQLEPFHATFAVPLLASSRRRLVGERDRQNR